MLLLILLFLGSSNVEVMRGAIKVSAENTDIDRDYISVHVSVTPPMTLYTVDMLWNVRSSSLPLFL